MTELKECRASKDLINKERQCTKKLNFIDIEVPKDSEQQDIMKLDVSLSGNGNLSDSSLLEQLKLQSLPKRKSAPGALAKKKNDKQKNLNYYFQKENISRKRERSISPDNDLKTSEELTKRLQSDCNKLNEENTVNFTPITQNKKRKLFNPSESHLSKDFPLQNVQCSYPYPESPPTVKKNEVRSTRKKEFSALPSKSDDDSSTEDSQEQRRKDVLDIAMPRNSLSLFIINNKERNTSNKVKLTPTIVFTSVGSR